VTPPAPSVSIRTMVHREQLLARIADPDSEAGIWFDDLRRALRLAGFRERARGTHFVYSRRGDAAIVTLQARSGKAPPYQVRQVRGLVR
jgi:hypothetical protein